jgi:hypothetical protein
VIAWRGSTRLAAPPLEGVGMDVFATSPAGERTRCRSEWWRGRTFCDGDGTVVDSWFGYSGPGDDTGEFHRQWPGTRVSIPTVGTTIELRFGRVYLGTARMKIDVSTAGEQQLTPVVAGQPLETKRAYYQDTLVFDVPPELRGVHEFKLRIEERSPGGAIVFSRHLP